MAQEHRYPLLTKPFQALGFDIYPDAFQANMQIKQLEHGHYLSYSFQGTYYNCRASEVDQYTIGMSAGISLSGNLGSIWWGTHNAEGIVLANSYYSPPLIGRNWAEFVTAHQSLAAKFVPAPDSWMDKYSGPEVRTQLLTTVWDFLRFIHDDDRSLFEERYSWVNRPSQTDNKHQDLHAEA